MIPSQAGYENSPLTHPYMGGLEQKILFQSDQKNVFDQYNDIHHHPMMNLHNKNINSNSGSENNRNSNDNQIGLPDENNLQYKSLHHHHQPSTDDLFGSEYKVVKNPLIQYDTPSDGKYYQSNIQASNDESSQPKKLHFMNQQSTPKANQKCAETFNSASKLPQDLHDNRESKDLLIANQYLPRLPKKELFNNLLDSDVKNSTQVNAHQPNLQKSVSSDPKKPSSVATQSLPNGLQKQQSAIVTGGEKLQSTQQIQQSGSTQSINNAKTAGELVASKQSNSGDNNNRNGQKKLTGSTSTATASTNSHNYPYYYSGNSNMNYPHNSHSYQHSSQQQSNTSSRGYISTTNNNQQQQQYTNSSSTQSNSSIPNNNSHYYYPNHSSSSSLMYPPHGHQANHHSHHLQHPYSQEEMDYGYTDMYGYYYPPYPPMPVGDHIDGKKAEGDQADESGLIENEEYKKYYYGHGSSNYGYYPPIPPTQTSQTGNNATSPASQSNNQQPTSNGQSSNGTNPPSQTTTGLISTTQNGEYIHHGDKYDHSAYMRGYYDPKGYYPPSHSYYYPPMNDMHMTNPHQGSKKASKKASNSSSYNSHIIPQPSYTGIKGSTAASNGSKYEQASDMYGYPMDPSFNPYSMPSHHSSGIYCDSSYYTHDQQHPKTSTMNFKKPSNQSDKENILSKSNNSNKENQPLIKEKVNSSQVSQKAPPQTQSTSQNSKKQQNELSENNDFYLDNQESSQQGLSASHEIRKRKRKNNDQLKILKIEYQKGGFWGKEKILEVAQITGLSESQVYKWCWDQKKKRLEVFKKKLGTKLLAGSDQQFEDMSGEGMEDESYKHTGSPEKQLKLNDESGVVPLKTNISKLSNDFTINQLQEKVLATKTRALQNITDKVLSRQNSKQTSTNLNQIGEKGMYNKTNQQDGQHSNQENINPENSAQQFDDVSKRLHFNSVY